jgi:hypothetical protein
MILIQKIFLHEKKIRMKMTVIINDSKLKFFLELMNSLNFVQVVGVKDYYDKKHVLASLKQGVKEMKLIKAGRLKGRPVQELLDEL